MLITVFLSCDSQPNRLTRISDLKNSPAQKHNKQENFTPSKFIQVAKVNKPKIVKCGKPVVVMNSPGQGVPFFTNYSTDQGLGLNEITSIVTDSLGNLWLGTMGGGVSKYDGKSFTTYTTAHGLGANGIGCMTVDKSGNIWFGTYGGGLCEFDGESFTNHWKFHASFIYCVVEDKFHYIWFGTDYGVYRFDGRNFVNYWTANGLGGNWVQCIIQDNSGYLWMGTEKGVSRFDGKNFVNYTMSNGPVNAMMQDKSGIFWIGTKRGVSKFDGKNFSNFTTEEGLASNDVTSINQDNSGNLWFGTSSGGVSKYDGVSFSTYTTSQALASNNVRCIARDNSGNLWIGTSGGGVSKYAKNGFTDFTPNLGLNNNIIKTIVKDKSGNIWFGTDGSGVIKYDGIKFTKYTTRQGLPSNSVLSIFQDKSENLWFGYFGGVCKYNGKCFVDYKLFPGGEDFVQCIGQDIDGNMWFGTGGDGVFTFDGKNFGNITITEGLAANNVLSFMLDVNNGDFWVGTYRGLSRFDERGITNYTTADGLAGDYVWSIVKDFEDGEVWMGTNGGGISRFDGKQFIDLNSARGLADNVILAMANDSIRNMIWIGSNLGLSNFKSGLRNNVNTIENFNKKTGYPINDLNSSALCVDNKGIVWAGCGDGKLIRFDYSEVKRNAGPLRLVIQGVKVNNQTVCWNNLTRKKERDPKRDSMNLLTEVVTNFGRNLSPAVLDSMRKRHHDIKFDSISRFYPVPINLQLPYADNNLTIEFAAIEPDLPKLVRYQYKLEGYSGNWSPESNSTTAVFGNIPEGSYTFRLKALSPDGILSETLYRFRVLPPWYRSWWAYTFYGLGLFGLIYFTDRIRRKIIIERERAKSRERELAQAREIEKAYTELKATQAQLIHSEKMASLGELTAGIAHEIQNPLNFVKNFSEVNKELIDEMRDEIDASNLNEVKLIASNIDENEEKIVFHAKRADAIVKGMLQHSRSSSGVKEPTDINALCDEYLRLAYHGSKAKDKSFNAKLETSFDKSIYKINIVPQDIGRAILNLINNAFYAVNEKQKQNLKGCVPIVLLSTTKQDGKIEIKVKDNGVGIPQGILDKIFQPFFTTKPTGQGTGLGLSLAYDIVKAHGGDIKVEAKEGEGSEFIVQLPVA
jgi:ligand-binding sensor domain-containing protein/signal transduction histidine kinase